MGESHEAEFGLAAAVFYLRRVAMEHIWKRHGPGFKVKGLGQWTLDSRHGEGATGVREEVGTWSSIGAYAPAVDAHRLGDWVPVDSRSRRNGPHRSAAELPRAYGLAQPKALFERGTHSAILGVKEGCFALKATKLRVKSTTLKFNIQLLYALESARGSAVGEVVLPGLVAVEAA